MTDKQAHLDEINRDWGWWTPEARNGARVWMTAQLEEAWSQAAYQRRHRTWALKEARTLAWHLREDEMLSMQEGETAEAERDKLATEILSLKSEMAEMVPIESCIPQEHYDKLAQRVKRLEEALNDVWARMDRARSILQDPKLGGNPKDHWMMLDTRVDRARAALEEA